MSSRLVDGVNPKSGTLLETNPELIEKICAVLRIGAYIEVAAALNGIGYNTLRSWVIKGKSDPDSMYGKFLRAVEKAFSEAEIRDLATIDKFANGQDAQYEMEVVREKDRSIIYDSNGKPMMQIARDAEGKPIIKRSEIRPKWEAAAWKMARRNPKRWGQMVDAANESSIMDVEQETAPREREVISIEQKNKKIAEVKQLVMNREALDDDPYLNG